MASNANLNRFYYVNIGKPITSIVIINKALFHILIHTRNIKNDKELLPDDCLPLLHDEHFSSRQTR